MSERPTPAPAIGASSLLVMFAVLCLIVFALLTLSTAQTDARLSQASAQAVSDYYAADSAAQDVLAQLRAGQHPPGVSEENGVYSYICNIDDAQELQVQARRNENGSWTVLRWQAVASGDWQADERLNVWTGD